VAERAGAGTVRDYFDDFKAILHVSAFRKVVEQVRCSRLRLSPFFSFK
jgi:hypothetical protein